MLKNAEEEIVRESVVEGFSLSHELRIKRQRVGHTGMTIYRERKDDKNEDNYIVYGVNWLGVKRNFYYVREDEFDKAKYKQLVILRLKFSQEMPMVPNEGYPLEPTKKPKSIYTYWRVINALCKLRSDDISDSSGSCNVTVPNEYLYEQWACLGYPMRLSTILQNQHHENIACFSLGGLLFFGPILLYPST